MVDLNFPKSYINSSRSLAGSIGVSFSHVTVITCTDVSRGFASQRSCRAGIAHGGRFIIIQDPELCLVYGFLVRSYFRFAIVDRGYGEDTDRGYMFSAKLTSQKDSYDKCIIGTQMQRCTNWSVPLYQLTCGHSALVSFSVFKIFSGWSFLHSVAGFISPK